MIRSSRIILIILVQFIVIVFLGSWLLVEYVHNLFMQSYVANFWASNGGTIPLVFLASALAAGGFYVVFTKNRETRTEQVTAVGGINRDSEVAGGIRRPNFCPFCNIALISITENRFHCRRCRRYFKD